MTIQNNLNIITIRDSRLRSASISTTQLISWRNGISEQTLYQRLGSYDAIAAVANDLLPREKQLLIDFLCANSGGPLFYTGRDMKTSHKGMKISESDWTDFLGHLNVTLDAFQVPATERGQVLGFIESTKADIVEV